MLGSKPPLSNLFTFVFGLNVTRELFDLAFTFRTLEKLGMHFLRSKLHWGFRR